MSYGFKNLVVWHKSYDFTLEIYKITRNFPKEEIYGLTSQIRRASVSIGANLAEGYSRSYLKEFIRYVSIAIGSYNEVEHYLMLSKDLNYLNKESYDKLRSNHREIGRMLHGLIKGLKKKQKEIKNISND